MIHGHSSDDLPAAFGVAPASLPASDVESERLHRVRLDFSLTEEAALEAIRSSIPDATMEDLGRWRSEGVLETRVIDGSLMFFNRSPRNLLRTIARSHGRSVAPSRAELEHHIQSVIGAGRRSPNGLCCPIRFRAEHTVSVKPGAVPEGKMIRCWLPFPREEPHQTDVRLIATEPPEHVLAPTDAPQRTVYLEQPAKPPGEPTVFQACYEFTAWASRHDPHRPAPRLQDPPDPRFTAERPPHVVFTPEVRSLVKDVVGHEPNLYLRAKRIFDWMMQNIRYEYEIEYSTIPNLTERCLARRAGDCGVQAMLFITLCRAAGVPARWESGWYPQPLQPNMHDWARFHVEPHGWLWADPSRGGHEVEQGGDPSFYFGNVDAFRLVANADWGAPFTPAKRFLRSDTVDNQRGELEWDGGNLYYDQWDWKMRFQRPDESDAWYGLGR